MTLSELPLEIQEQLRNERAVLHTKWYQNTPYDVCFTNLEGTRFFRACRISIPYSDDKGNYMPFGGGSKWRISYGKILWDIRKDPLGGKEYYWKKTNQLFRKSANGTEIPATVSKKADVMDIAKRISTLILEL